MKLYGVTRVRNEEHMIADTLNHVAQFCHRVYVLDDASTDHTVGVCKSHPVVARVFCGKGWNPNPDARAFMEGWGRTVPYRAAVEDGADYVYVFDADERAEFDHFDFTRDTYKMRLFAYYITPEDVDWPYNRRKWIGPEYQDITMIYRAVPRKFTQRAMASPQVTGKEICGYVKHYGKAVSVEEWDRTCDYYVNHRWRDRPALRQRWEKRRGKAIHDGKSDFGRDLIQWDDRKDTGKIVELKQ